ncbi:DUF1150 family protein [Neptunicoccus sediminis]|uniref:DUF1150 family protein n=1 Tax=Neptunicoccus sediminis TaxID=1892596 RepID=UPI000845F369|nr:DUF1150 family protein [Neptunicoccus sediminis]
MDVKFNFPFKFDDRTVYVRPVEFSDLPEDLREQLNGDEHIYAIHSESGERLALAKDREIAFALARTNEFEPVSVH